MAHETVLIVDDAPVNLKLADILLRKEGFEVHTAGDAEEALMVLRTVHPDLILVDIQLPGMNGLELTRRIKASAYTQDILVVALTACAMDGDAQLAFEAGCCGYITKPIDTVTLVPTIRRLMGQQPAGAGDDREPVLVGVSLSDIEMESLKRRFLEEGTLQARQLLEALDSHFDAPKANRLAHRWVGTAGTLGYPNISEMAREVEALVSEPAVHSAGLRAAVQNLVEAFDEPRDASFQPPSDAIVQVLSGKRIGMVGFPPDESERLCEALEMAGARPCTFAAEVLPDSDVVRDCSVVMIHVQPQTIRSRWLAASSAAPEQAMILAGRREDIMAVDGAVQARAQEFLIDGWQPEEALMRLTFALSRGPSVMAGVPAQASAPKVATSSEVLIADDDPTMRSLVRSTLGDYGLDCRVANNGTDALNMIREHRPGVVVLDVSMPGLDGFMVLAKIREESLPVRVVLLTARKHENDVSRGFSLGADDYIVKPFNPIELVARVKRFLRH